MNTAPHDSHDGETDLQWLAFRYIAGEMLADEAADFEQRMQTDLAACEAVAAQVELTQTVFSASQLQETAAPAVSTPAVSANRNTRMLPYIAVIAAAVAACLMAFVAGGWMVGNAGSNSPEVASPGAVDTVSPELATPELATQWSNARRDLKDAWPQALPADEAEEDLDETLANIDADDADGDAEAFGAPSWMLAAVAVQTPKHGEEELEN